MTNLAPGQETGPAERARPGRADQRAPGEREPGRAYQQTPGARAGPTPAGDVLAAMADPTRRQILAELAARGPATATELAGGLPITRQAVAKHLAALSQAGLVVSSKHGRDVRFEARTENLAETADWLTQLAAEWDARLTAIKRIAESG
jgi:DNA-binding transcriptional ArsR family regulator